ncbi:MAG TPA: FHA domain-containing protein [Verrucomicrobiae bacterium]|nr:FHA domain-containing protein [Verrucomicrobiae bacterium]
MPTLTIQLPGLPSVEHIVREDAITLGRMKGNSIALNDSSVSLSHAKITRVGNDFFLKDLNSTNGTMLNGQSITEARVRDGDQLKFGEVIAYFRLEPLSPPAAAPVTAEPAPLPKFIAQSVPTPLAAPAAVPLVSSPPAPALRSSVPVLPKPPSPATRRTSLRLPLLIVCGIAVLAVAAVLVWKYQTGSSAPAAAAPPVAAVAAKSAPAITSNLASAPAKPAATPPHDPNLDNLVKGLKSPDPAVRRRAASAIYNLGPGAKPILPSLPGSLADTDPDVRMWVALALVHNNVFEKASIPILVQTLHNANPTLRQVACLSLAMIPYTGADKEPVIAALVDTATKDESPDVSNDAMTALKIIAPDLMPGK